MPLQPDRPIDELIEEYNDSAGDYAVAYYTDEHKTHIAVYDDEDEFVGDFDHANFRDYMKRRAEGHTTP